MVACFDLKLLLIESLNGVGFSFLSTQRGEASLEEQKRLLQNQVLAKTLHGPAWYQQAEAESIASRLF